MIKLKLSDKMIEIPIEKKTEIMLYQSQVTKTIYNDQGYIIWTAYNPNSDEEEEVLILDCPNGEQKVMANTKDILKYYYNSIDKGYGIG